MALTSPAFLLTHPTSVSYTHFPKVLPSSLAPVPFALPSRFPSPSLPLTSVSDTGHVYLYSHSSHLIWEYNSTGRRISELSFPGQKISSVCSVGSGSEVIKPSHPNGAKGEQLLVSLKGEEELKMMQKVDNKWTCVSSLQGPTGRVTALVVSKDHTLLAAGSEDGELVVFDQVKGTQQVVPLGNHLTGPISSLMAFSPSIPNTILIPSGSVLLRINLSDWSPSSVDIHKIHPFSSTSKGDNDVIIDMAFSPVVSGSDGSKRGGLCAVLNRSGDVGLVGLDNPDAAVKIISFDQAEMAGLIFLDGATLAARTTKGSLLVKDLRSLSKPPKEINCAQPVIDIQLIPSSSRAPRPSLAAPSSTSSRRSVLGEARDRSNIPTPTPPAVPNGKGKEPAGSVLNSAKPDSSCAPAPTEIEPKTISLARYTVETHIVHDETRSISEDGRREKRVVSAPQSISRVDLRGTRPHPNPESQLRPRASSSRLRPGPSAMETSNVGERSTNTASEPKEKAQVHVTLHLSHVARSATPVTIIEEDEGEDEDINRASSVRHQYRRAELIPGLLPQPDSRPATTNDRIADVENGDEAEVERSIQLDWALQPQASSSHRNPLGVEASRDRRYERMEDAGISDAERMEEMRRMIGDLQLDMLRMGRGLRSEIRKAVQPLLVELEENKEVMEKQRREIERLRRGY